MTCWNKCILVVGLSASFFAGKALADEPRTTSGFHGDIMIGGMWSSSENRLVPGDDNKKLSSLADGDGKDSEVGLLGMGNLSYTTYSGTQLFASFDGDVSTGIKRDFLGIAQLTLAGVFQMNEVWKDPYLTGVDRVKTDETRTGGRLGLGGILGTGLNIDYCMMSIEVDDDLSGTTNPLLKRDGITHVLTTSYAIPLGENNSLTPQIQYEIGDIDGKSNSYDSWGSSLTHTFINKNMMLATTVSVAKSEYDHSHPVFNKTRDEETYGISSTLTWFNPLGCENYFVNVMGAYAKTDSNIDFFDSTDTMVGMGVGYRF